MILWRISNYATLDGWGGLKISGRWHTRGHRVVYLSSTPASALLEILVHLEISVDDVPKNYSLLQIEAPADIVIENLKTLADLPDNWEENQVFTREAGNFWLDRNSAALLEVPSALAPHTSNFLMNPQHPDAARIRIASVAQYRIDERLLR